MSAVGPDQQARSAHRRKRHRRQQFRVVLQAMLRHRRWPRKNRTRTRRANAPCETAAWQPPALPFASSMIRCCGLQPVRGAAQPDSSSARRNSCRRKGCAAPASAFQLARVDLRDAVEKSRRAVSHAWAARGLACGLGLDSFQILVGVERRHAAGARRGDGLAVHMIGHIAGGEYAGNAGARWRRPRCRL